MAVKSDYNPVEEPSWNSAASFAISALQNGASWLSPLGSGAPAVSPSRGASQREQCEVHLSPSSENCMTASQQALKLRDRSAKRPAWPLQHTLPTPGGVMPPFLDCTVVTFFLCYMAGKQLADDTLDTALGAAGLASSVRSGWLTWALPCAEPFRAISAHRVHACGRGYQWAPWEAPAACRSTIPRLHQTGGEGHFVAKTIAASVGITEHASTGRCRCRT